MPTDIRYTRALKSLKVADPTLARLIEQVGPCRLAQHQQTGDLLAVLCEAIISQQLSIKAAETIHQRFLALFPEQLSASHLLALEDDTLRGAGLSRPKVTYLKGLARQVLNGLPTLDELEILEDEAIIDTLTQVKGVGRWTVEMLLIFRLHRWDVFPIDDLGIKTAIRKLYSLPEVPDKPTLLRIGQAWQPYRTIASWYLWRSLE